MRRLVSGGGGRERIGRLLSFTMKSTSCGLAGTIAVGSASSFFGRQ